MTRNLRSLIVLALLTLFVVIAARRCSRLPSMGDLFTPKPITIDNSPLLVKDIRAIAQLMTIEYYDEVVVDSSRSSGGKLISIPPFILPVRPSLVLIAKARLLAGLDLQRLDSSHISGTRDSVAIRLPRAQVLEVIMNPSDVETFVERGTWTQQAVVALHIKARTQVLRNAQAQGVLRRAEEKAITLVEQLMLNAGFKKVTVTME